MNNLYIYHHLGLGDHIICNGLVRYIISLAYANNYFLFAKKQYYVSVCSMYSDINNLNIIEVDDDKFVETFLCDKQDELIQIGFHHMSYNKFKFDEDFYQQLNVPFNYRWELFKINRNKEKELELFKKYDITENNYIFLHDDSSRNYNINKDLIINENLKVITPIIDYTNNILDYCYILENAHELHFMDSSFRLLYDSLEDKKQLSFYHTYVRGKSNQNISNSKKQYIIL